MGFFSFKTQDTNSSIPNIHSNRNPFTVYMTDNNGHTWVEDEYDGYGVFGGKDFYELLAEMNGYGSDRIKGINLHLGISGIRNKTTGKIFQSSNVDFFNWDSDKLIDGQTANKLIASGEWVIINVKTENIKFPMLTKKRPKVWVNNPINNCKYQGFFY